MLFAIKQNDHRLYFFFYFLKYPENAVYSILSVETVICFYTLETQLKNLLLQKPIPLCKSNVDACHAKECI